MIESDPILVEPVRATRNRSQAEQSIADVVDHPAEQEAKGFPGWSVGVGRHLVCDRESKDVVVKASGAVDVGSQCVVWAPTATATGRRNAGPTRTEVGTSQT